MRLRSPTAALRLGRPRAGRRLFAVFPEFLIGFPPHTLPRLPKPRRMTLSSLAAKRMSGFLVVENGEPLRNDIPTLHLSDFEAMVRQSGVEIRSRIASSGDAPIAVRLHIFASADKGVYSVPNTLYPPRSWNDRMFPSGVSSLSHGATSQMLRAITGSMLPRRSHGLSRGSELRAQDRFCLRGPFNH